MPLATPTLTNISTKAQIYLAESPIHFNFQNELADARIASVTIEVYIWRGFQTTDLPVTPRLVFNNVKKVSPADKYIAIELHNEIKAFITSSNLNKNNPQYAYNTTSGATTAGEGVYFHIVYKVDTESVKQLGSFFATSGYRYSFEQLGGPYTSYNDVETARKFAKSINYDKFTINLTTVASTSQSGSGANGLILQQTVAPATRLQQTGVTCKLAYLNRLGLWDTFTPFGKFVTQEPIKRDEFASTYRNPLQINSQIQHLKQNGSPTGFRKFAINTGLIDESNNYQIRELKSSSKIYLIIFGNDVFTDVQAGITVDSTSVTVDNTAITVDSDVVTLADIGFYSKFTQIPVRVVGNDFTIKTRLNEKSSISYALEFEETNNFINNIL
jgi:hypothetical protein